MVSGHDWMVAMLSETSIQIHQTVVINCGIFPKMRSFHEQRSDVVPNPLLVVGLTTDIQTTGCFQ
jgi:hypothetical protein